MDISHGIPFASPMKIYAGDDDDDVADDLDFIIEDLSANTYLQKKFHRLEVSRRML